MSQKTPIVFIIGVFFILQLVYACESEKSPAQVTLLFWKAIAENDLSLAQSYCNTQPPNFFDTQVTALNQTTFDSGKIVMEDNHATVETLISPTFNNKTSFSTFLIRQENHWKVICKQSLENLSDNPFNAFFKQLDSLGEIVNKQLEKQLPIIEKEINILGEKLKQQFDEFENERKNASPQKQTDPYQNTI